MRKLGNLHAGFLAQCRAVGITAAYYPLNTERMGIRSLSAYVTAKILTNFGDAARAAGRSAVRPYQVVEFDGHRLDVRLKIVIRDPLGFEQEFEIERIWLLVIGSPGCPACAQTLPAASESDCSFQPYR